MNSEQKLKVDALAALISAETYARLTIDSDRSPDPALHREIVKRDAKVTITERKKYILVDVGTSGRYIIEAVTGEIFGIKGYGVIHRGHQFGTLDTISEWYWGDFRPYRRKPTRIEEQALKIKSQAPGISVALLAHIRTEIKAGTFDVDETYARLSPESPITASEWDAVIDHLIGTGELHI